jgi:hypothetical protein
VVVEHLPLVATELNHQAPEQVVTAAQARHQPFLAAALLTQVVVALALKMEPQEQAALAVALTGLETIRPLLLARPTLVAVAVVAAGLSVPVVTAALAALASSSSSTTSALPQSSPSSHRRSGLRQRVR